jgi:hypothetical protein
VKSNPLVNSHNSRLGCQSIVDYLDVIEKVETGSIAENIENITIRYYETRYPQSHAGCNQ